MENLKFSRDETLEKTPGKKTLVEKMLLYFKTETAKNEINQFRIGTNNVKLYSLELVTPISCVVLVNLVLYSCILEYLHCKHC